MSPRGGPGRAAPVGRQLPGEGIHTIAPMELDDGSIELLIESLGDARSDLWRATVEVAR